MTIHPQKHINKGKQKDAFWGGLGLSIIMKKITLHQEKLLFQIRPKWCRSIPLLKWCALPGEKSRLKVGKAHLEWYVWVSFSFGRIHTYNWTSRCAFGSEGWVLAMLLGHFQVLTSLNVLRPAKKPHIHGKSWSALESVDLSNIFETFSARIWLLASS